MQTNIASYKNLPQTTAARGAPLYGEVLPSVEEGSLATGTELQIGAAGGKSLGFSYLCGACRSRLAPLTKETNMEEPREHVAALRQVRERLVESRRQVRTCT